MSFFASKFVLLFLTVWQSIPITKCIKKFEIDDKTNQFLLDGQPFRYVSGSLHYFRVPSVLWNDRMLSYRAAGINAIETYVEWSSHEPEIGEYDFTGDNDLIAFLRLAQKNGLYVILRPGPYICAERDMGGLPYWLLTINPKMRLRTSDETYLKQVDKWFDVLLPRLRPLLYANGGPILMAQVENEYGSFGACDYRYTTYLRDLFKRYFGDDVLLFTTDGDSDSYLKCGKIEGIFATVDFGPGTNVTEAFAAQHRHQEYGPNVNSEYYPGWLDHWEEPHQVVSAKEVCETLDQILAVNASVNLYVLHGGTSFGFGAGANMESGVFSPQLTSYDYNAPLTEAGDPTDKYFAVRNVIGKYVPLPNVSLPVVKAKMQVLNVEMVFVQSVFKAIESQKPIHSKYPMTFEQLRQRNGFILYNTTITTIPSDPSVLAIPGLNDRAFVFVDQQYQGTLSRTRKTFQLPINADKGSKLAVMVENQGRVSYGQNINDLKGITSNVTLGSVKLTDWDHFRLFDDWSARVTAVITQSKSGPQESGPTKGIPAFFVGQFVVPDQSDYPLDTFLQLSKGWQKGIAFLNGFNLGRYWAVGPQLTLYCPKHLFRPYPQNNTIVLFETERPCFGSKCSIDFVKTPVINGTTPSNL